MNNNISKELPFTKASGPVVITLRNDLMFHYVMQRSKEALKFFICAAKNLNPSEVKDVTIKNPIEIDEAVSNEIILDVLVTLNNDEIFDIELQLYYDREWIKRSLLYLCRTYDSSLSSNDEAMRKYEKLKATTLIAIIDKSVGFKSNEFYSHYRMMNTKTHVEYSSLLNINVLNLSHIELATDEDINSGLTGWAKLFNAQSWEDVNSVISGYPFLTEVAKIMYEANADIKQRSMMRAHEEYLTRVRSAESRIKEAEDKADKIEAEAQIAIKNAESKAKEAEDKADKIEAEAQKAIKESEDKVKEAKDKADKIEAEAQKAIKEAEDRAKNVEAELKDKYSRIAELEAKLREANIMR